MTECSSRSIHYGGRVAIKSVVSIVPTACSAMEGMHAYSIDRNKIGSRGAYGHTGRARKMLWSYYNKLKEEGFNDEQAFELTKRAAPKQMEMKLKKKE